MITLSESIKRDINSAFAEGHPIVVCGVTDDGEPTVSFRGTAQAFGDSAVAFWVRKPGESTITSSIQKHPVVVAVYANMPARRFYQLRGNARRADDLETRKQVFEASHEFERNQDPEMKGTAIIIDLTSVRGRGEEGMVNLS